MILVKFSVLKAGSQYVVDCRNCRWQSHAVAVVPCRVVTGAFTIIVAADRY